MCPGPNGHCMRDQPGTMCPRALFPGTRTRASRLSSPNDSSGPHELCRERNEQQAGEGHPRRPLVQACVQACRVMDFLARAHTHAEKATSLGGRYREFPMHRDLELPESRRLVGCDGDATLRHATPACAHAHAHDTHTHFRAKALICEHALPTFAGLNCSLPSNRTAYNMSGLRFRRSCAD